MSFFIELSVPCIIRYHSSILIYYSNVTQKPKTMVVPTSLLYTLNKHNVSFYILLKKKKRLVTDGDVQMHRYYNLSSVYIQKKNIDISTNSLILYAIFFLPSPQQRSGQKNYIMQITCKCFKYTYHGNVCIR